MFVNLVQLYKNERQQVDYQIWRFISIGLAIWAAYLVLKSRDAWLNKDFYRATTLVLLVIVFVAGAAGRTFGLYVRDVSSYKHEIWTKAEKLVNAKLILMLSHHSVLYLDEKVIAIPTTEITKIVGQESDSFGQLVSPVNSLQDKPHGPVD